MATGVVKFFNPIEGFGLIAPDDRSRDVVILGSALKQARSAPPVTGQRVAYELCQDRKWGGVVVRNLHIDP
jgi:cold shock CspA family protein